MPQLDLTGNNLGHTQIVLKGNQTISAGNAAIFQNIPSMDTFLLSNGWTQVRLDKLGKNDKIFECRRVIGVALDAK